MATDPSGFRGLFAVCLQSILHGSGQRCWFAHSGSPFGECGSLSVSVILQLVRSEALGGQEGSVLARVFIGRGEEHVPTLGGLRPLENNSRL